MNTIKLSPSVGSFAEDKDKAREIRVLQIIPILEKGERVVLDFEKVDSITQSFAHALLSELIRNYGIDVLDRIDFSNCNDTVREIIKIVVEYMQ
jgi:hypothetical protein